MKKIKANKNNRVYTFFASFIIIIFILLSTIIIYKANNIEGEYWRREGNEFYRSRDIEILPIRGNIYSSNNTPISMTGKYYKIYLDLGHEALKDNKLKKDSVKKELSKFADLMEDLAKKKNFKFNKREKLKSWISLLPKKKNRYVKIFGDNRISYLDYEEIKDLEPLALIERKKGVKVKSLMSKVLGKDDVTVRLRPYDPLAMRTIGSVYLSNETDNLTKAKSGLEYSYNEYLRGKKGKARIRYIAKNQFIQTLQEAEDGANVYSTLDMNLQSIVYNALLEKVEEVKPVSASAILMEVKTGKIRAICNLGLTNDGRYAETENYAISDRSEPGSTFKVASMLVALNDGKVNPNDSIDVGNGIWSVSGRNVRDHNADRGGYGRISVSEGIQFSSNVALAKIITEHYGKNPDEFVEKVKALGFGKKLEIDLGDPVSYIRKKSEEPKRWYGTTLAWMSFGYETSISPIYTLSFFNAIANNGTFMRPYFVDSVVSAKGILIKKQEPKILIEKIAKDSAIKDIQDMLRLVVDRGTGKRLKNDFISISGKSGTAQLADGGSYKGSGGIRHQVSFAAYFPSENPEYSAIVVIRKPSIGNPGGGSMAGPVIRDIATRIYTQRLTTPIDSIPVIKDNLLKNKVLKGNSNHLASLLDTKGVNIDEYKGLNKSLEIRFDANGDVEKINKVNTLSMVVPNVVGMTAIDASLLLSKQGYIPIIEGYGWVKSQSLTAGSKHKKGTKIYLKLGR